MVSMERRQEGPQTPFEVYCYHCQASFAAGTRRCVHCGQRLGGAPKRPEALLAAEAHEAEIAEPSIGRRVGGISLWVLIAVGAAITRMCGGS